MILSMEAISPTPSLPANNQQESERSNALPTQQTMLFSDSLKDLKSMRSQLYSAAEYFELSYNDDDYKKIVMNTLKDYAVEALVNAMDHLGSVSYKVKDLLNQEVDGVSGAELRVSCIEQRLLTCQGCIDQEGRSQQSLVIRAPKYHKHYMLRVAQTTPESGAQHKQNYQEFIPFKDDNKSKQFLTVKFLASRGRTSASRTVHSSNPSCSSSPSRTMQRARSLSPRKARSPSPSRKARSPSPSRKARSPSPAPRPLSSKDLITETRGNSPLRTVKSLSRPGSPTIRQTIPSSSKKFLLGSQSSTIMHTERNKHKQTDQNPTKGRGFLKALLTRRRSRTDELLYSYLDEYY